MKKSDKFEWTDKAQAAFYQLKALLSTQPLLAAPHSKEPLLLYITTTSQVVSTVLTVEREEEGKAQKLQRPVYYISEVLTISKQRYPHYQKLVYGTSDGEEGGSLLPRALGHGHQRRSPI
jgi:hypothetical protein